MFDAVTIFNTSLDLIPLLNKTTTGKLERSDRFQWMDYFNQINSVYLQWKDIDETCRNLRNLKSSSIVFKELKFSGFTSSDLESLTDPSFYLNNDCKLKYNHLSYTNN